MVNNFSTDVTFQLNGTSSDYTVDSLVLSYVPAPIAGSKEYFLCKVTSDASIYFTLRNPDSSEAISLNAFTSLDNAWEGPLMEAGQTYELRAFCTDNVSQSVTVHIDTMYKHIAG
ncbi:hypothetical protein L8P27_16725 [Enterobacter asburiae]|uniref:hypothetical protein n=1 Tax=Enterobacter asburiae TaxID=61645 RepID=UPI00200470C0|nr:hypothetical protein [Enterobacter asburiae]MCK7229456.1 hypothetical protein [Enterobacter asburiae]